MARFVRGDTRQVKVLGPDSTGHRGYLLAFNKALKQAIVLAGTSGKGFVWGRLYLCEERHVNEWLRVVREVACVPQTADWSLAEAVLDDRDGHPDY